jgi:hypothetical protein
VLPIGLATAILDQVLSGFDRVVWLPAMLTFGTALLTVAYIRAGVIVLDVHPPRRQLAKAFAAGAVAFLPFPFLMLGFILPGIAWLALVGLVVPVVLVEDPPYKESFSRAVALAKADYVHALGSLATLVIVYFLTRTVLVLLLQGQGVQTERIALFFGDLVISPLLFLGASLLYVDQKARLELARQRAREA